MRRGASASRTAGTAKRLAFVSRARVDCAGTNSAYSIRERAQAEEKYVALTLAAE